MHITSILLSASWHCSRNLYLQSHRIFDYPKNTSVLLLRMLMTPRRLLPCWSSSAVTQCLLQIHFLDKVSQNPPSSTQTQLLPAVFHFLSLLSYLFLPHSFLPFTFFLLPLSLSLSLRDRVSLHSPSRPRTHRVAQAT
jgi:hypothetical protein